MSTHTVRMWVNAVCASGSPLTDDCEPIEGLVNPCPGSLGCAVQATCVENADVPVTFNLTLMASARQGFFDVAVTFNSVFCSAKLDTCYPGNDGGPDVPIMLLHDELGTRQHTAVVAVACTAGPGDIETVLHFTELVVRCGTDPIVAHSLNVSEVVQEGNLRAPNPTLGELVAAIHYGTESLPDVNKVYTNVSFLIPEGQTCSVDWTIVPSTSAVGPQPQDGADGTLDVVAAVVYDPELAVVTEGGCTRSGLNSAGGGVQGDYLITGPIGYVGSLSIDAQAFSASVGVPAPLIEVSIVAVDAAGDSMDEIEIFLDGAWVTLPTSVELPEGEPLGATLVRFCGHDWPIDPEALIVSADVDRQHRVASGLTEDSATPGQQSITLELDSFSPRVWMPFDTPSPASQQFQDVIDGWLPQGPPPETFTSDAQVGAGALDLTSTSGHPIHYYARLVNGVPFGNDASFRQREWLHADSFSVELLFKAAAPFKTGMSNRLWWLTERISLDLTPDGFRVSGVVDATFALDQTGRRSLEHVLDGAWHHLALTYDHRSGEMKLYIDGISPDGWTHYHPPGTTLPNATGLWISWQFSPLYLVVDEYAGYIGALSPGIVHLHAEEALGLGLPYRTCTPPVPLPPPEDLGATVGGLDSRYLPPGYPDFFVASGNPDALSALEQLQSYPLPRYLPGHTLPRQWSWMDPSYLGGRGQPGVSQAMMREAEAAIAHEMASHWGYALTVNNNLAVIVTIPLLTELANTHPEWPTFAIAFWPQLRPTTYVSGGWVLDQDDQDHLDAHGMTLSNNSFIMRGVSALSIDHFTNDGEGNVLDSTSSRKSPVSPLRTWEIDGRGAAWRMQAQLDALAPRVAAGARALDHINENGEVVYTYHISQTTAMGDPAVMADIEANSPSVITDTSPLTFDATQFRLYLARATTNIRNAYLDQLRAATPDTLFTWYAIDGFRHHRALYEEARFVLDPVGGTYRATPDLYPRQAAWWYMGAGPWHGFHWSGLARRYEIDAGDKLYWPFLAAGWNNDPKNNMLPGQWLGLLKTFAALGADTWYPAFFSLQSPFPRPEGYVWQAAAASYAHAITSRYEDLLRQGDLVEARASWPPQASVFMDYFSLYTIDYRHLVVARRDQDRWLLAGTIQDTTTIAGRRPLWGIARIHFDFDDDGEEDVLRLPIRRQGSVYLWDRTTTPWTLIQLDRWHEPWHPSRWKAHHLHDAEVHDGLIGGPTASWAPYTDAPNAPDYTGFITSLRVEPANGTIWSSTGPQPLEDAPVAEYLIGPRELTDLSVWVRARVRNGGSGQLHLSLNEDDADAQAVTVAVSGSDWAWYAAGDIFHDVEPAACVEPPGGPNFEFTNRLRMRPGYDWIEVDIVLLTPDATYDPESETPEHELQEVGDL